MQTPMIDRVAGDPHHEEAKARCIAPALTMSLLLVYPGSIPLIAP